MSLPNGWDHRLEFPDGWLDAGIEAFDPTATVEFRKGDGVIAMVLLRDQTNVVALSWSTGGRYCRVGPDTGWRLDERYTGQPLRTNHDKRLADRTWRKLLDVLREARDYSAAEHGGLPS